MTRPPWEISHFLLKGLNLPISTRAKILLEPVTLPVISPHFDH